ncbi:MAG: PilZ domain-containing protein [Nitrospiraceae bacterium]
MPQFVQLSQPGRRGGSLLDLSLRGCRIFSTTAVLPGTTLQLQVHLSENAPPLTIDQGIVRWCRDKHFGLEFSTLKPDEWARLQQTVKVLEQQPYEQGEET